MCMQTYPLYVCLGIQGLHEGPKALAGLLIVGAERPYLSHKQPA